MSSITHVGARAVADLAQGNILASVELAAAPERVFQALASNEVIKWWVRPGVFDTQEWSGDVHAGGLWRAAGMTRGQPYEHDGEFIEVDRPRRLVHTWDGGSSDTPSTVTYLLEPLEPGTRLTLRHSGFVSRDMCSNFAIGWETSLEQLAKLLDGQ